jgi:PAS domain S-box-containing protein
MKSAGQTPGPFPNFRHLLVFCCTLWLLSVCGSAGIYLFRTHPVRAELKSPPAEGSRISELTAARILKETDEVITDALAVMAAVGAGLVLALALATRRAQKASQALLAASRNDAAREKTELEAQLHHVKMTEIDLQRERDEVRAQLVKMTQNYEALKEEFDKRKRSESNLAIQRQELSRSKDVLELHVQARTQELQKLKASYESILNSAGEGICGLDAADQITFANPAAASILGWDIEALRGKPADEIFRPVAGRINGHSPKEEGLMELVFHRQDGTEFEAEFCRAPLQAGNGSAGAVVVFKDITARKRSEDELTRKAAELARSNAELEQFAFVASHDLQEPLRKIQAFGDRLKEKCQNLQLEEGRDYLDRMQSAAERMQRLIGDLLAFSRVMRNTQPFAPVELKQVTKEVLGDLEVRIEQTKAKVEVGELPKIEADPVQMRQLLQNLISNSLKFQPRDATPAIQIQGRVYRRLPGQSADDTGTSNGHAGRGDDVVVADELCELTVRDNGIGFDEKYLDKIFAVFQRLHGKNEYEGTGVGLAVCRRIVDRHGGTITARSKPGEGATFIVTLPVRQNPKRN